MTARARSAGSRPSRLPAGARAWVGCLAPVVGLHLLGWGLCLACADAHPALPALGLSGYLFGLRHGFDADHIAAVDDSARLMVQQGRRPIGIGLHFSAGHCSVVFVLAALAAWCGASLRDLLPGLRDAGETVGTLVSAGFLWVVGLLNLATLLRMRSTQRGAAAVAGRWLSALRGPGAAGGWRMYAVGLLFGLGFDTASEIALLVLTGSAAAAGHAPRFDLLALPLLFAAGMVLVDTADGMLMTHAYAWARRRPGRGQDVNLALSWLSVGIALLTGTLELLPRAARGLHAESPLMPLLQAATRIRLDWLGMGIVAACVVAWGVGRMLAARSAT